MKTLLKSFALVATLFTAQQGFAQSDSVKLPEGSVSLNPISGDIVSFENTCPENARCITNGTKINLLFHLGGCLDRLGPVSHDIVVNEDGTVDIFVSAIRIANKRSLVAFCVAEPTAHHTITVPAIAGDENTFRLHFLGTPHTH